MTERVRADQILRAVSEATAATKGEEFFRALARHLASALGVDLAFVAECTDADRTRVRTLAVWKGQEFVENVTYSVAGTPCERVIGGEACLHPTGVCDLFPEDHALALWKVESYVGVPIRGSSGQILGHLAVLDQKPFDADLELSALKIFADRTGVELERQRTEEALLRSTRRLATLREIDRGILAARSPAAIGEAAMRHIRQLIPCLRASVTTFDLEAGRAILEAVHAEDPGRMRVGVTLPLEPFGDLEALRASRVHHVRDASTLPSTSTFDFLRSEGLRSWLNVPLVARGELIGTLNVGSQEVEGFSPQEIEAVREVADSLAVATQEARLVDQVQRHTGELEQRIAERTAELEAFSYSVAHDLRAPLRAIAGFSRVLLEEHAEALASEGQRLLGIISQNTEKMGQLIDALLALSRLGRQEMRLADVDLGQLAHEVYAELPAAPEREVDLRVDALPPVRGDLAMLRQLLANLLTNALKFTQPREAARIVVGHRSGHGETAYFVRDNGVGFDARYAERMFGVFQRLHRPGEFEGTGIGLAIVQSIVRRHGGRVWAEGQLDAGATVWFTLAPLGAAFGR